ncbi:MAG: macro domain-containing protein [Bacteroidetes bacterium]|nr:macro domain-containing protein [Bacteroidota bacterium]
MAIDLISGNIFNTKAQVVVNTVNCVGVMGKGIALVYKLRYPKMFDLYQEHCKSKLIGIGKLWLYKGEPDAPWVLNFPTKFHWKYPSKLEYIEKGLQKFLDTYKDQGIVSIAFPLLDDHNGGLDRDKVYQLMTRYLSKCEIPVEIFEYDPSAPDDLFESFALKWGSFSSTQIQKVTGIRKDRINTISTVVESKTIKSMIDLINEPGIGLVTMERCFSFIMRGELQKSLFD